MKIPTAVSLIMLSLVSTAGASDSRLQYWIQLNGGRQWQPPPEGIVRTGRAAITIARAIAADQPGSGSVVADEQIWQMRMKATLQDGVWEVTEQLPPGTLGGTCLTDISKT